MLLRLPAAASGEKPPSSLPSPHAMFLRLPAVASGEKRAEIRGTSSPHAAPARPYPQSGRSYTRSTIVASLGDLCTAVSSSSDPLADMAPEHSSPWKGSEHGRSCRASPQLHLRPCPSSPPPPPPVPHHAVLPEATDGADTGVGRG